MINLSELITPDAIKVPLTSTTKQAVIEELVDLLHQANRISNPQEVKRVVLEREQQRSTGIGEGLAIPHGKSTTLDDLIIAIGKPATPVEFEAIDKKPVRLLVLLVSPPNRTADHIQALGRISRLMSQDEFRQAVYDAESREEMYRLFHEAETARAGG